MKLRSFYRIAWVFVMLILAAVAIGGVVISVAAGTPIWATTAFAAAVAVFAVIGIVILRWVECRIIDITFDDKLTSARFATYGGDLTVDMNAPIAVRTTSFGHKITVATKTLTLPASTRLVYKSRDEREPSKLLTALYFPNIRFV